MLFTSFFSRALFIFILFHSTPTLNSPQPQKLILNTHEGFAFGTLVKTDSCYKKIEDIRPGQIVIAYDIQKQELTYRKVLNVFYKHVSHYVEITLNDTTIQTAANQKIYIPCIAKYVTAEELSKSAELQTAFHIPFSSIRLINAEADICMLTVEQDHNFFVSEQEILAHNFVPLVFIAPAAPAAAGIAVTVVIPAAKFAGAAVAGWIISRILGSLVYRPTPDGFIPQDLSKRDKADKKDSDKKDETRKYIGCGNNIQPQPQSGPRKQCNHSGEIPKSVGCGNNASPNDQNGLPPQKQCNHSKESQKAFEQSKVGKKIDAQTDLKTRTESLSREGGAVSAPSDKANNNPTQETAAKDLEMPAPETPTGTDGFIPATKLDEPAVQETEADGQVAVADTKNPHLIKVKGIKEAIDTSIKVPANSLKEINVKPGKHIFSEDHKAKDIMKLGASEEDIINTFKDCVKEAGQRGELWQGANDIITEINGTQTTVRVMIVNNEVINFNGFVGVSERTIGHKIFLNRKP